MASCWEGTRTRGLAATAVARADAVRHPLKSREQWGAVG